MASTDDEPDYMSEEFLASCVADVRPGLVFKHSTKRQFRLEEEHRAANEKIRKIQKPTRVLEAERREEGLSTTISQQNKGFTMLEKMGFKAGQGLGKSGEGRVEPVAIELKADRGGLGREAAIKEIMGRKLELLQKRIARQTGGASLEEFRNRKKDQAAQRLILADYGKSCRMCQVLDEERGVVQPVEPWFWPDKPKEPEEEEGAEKESEEGVAGEDEGNQLEPSEKLELLTSYLRRVHFYCTWCAAKFEDENDLSSTCPGPTRDDH